jgi:poly(A) polymerase
MSSNRNLESYAIVQRKLAEFSEEELKPSRLLTGADLIAAGYTPGPRFTEILGAVEDAQLEGRIHTAGEAIEMVREQFPLETTDRPGYSSAP